jgi:APA family basic amino acid/polyamine antiporter
MNETKRHPSALPRHIGWFTASCVLVSNVIGSGSFTTTGFMARDLGDPGLILSVWLIGGTLFCVLLYLLLNAF